MLRVVLASGRPLRRISRSVPGPTGRQDLFDLYMPRKPPSRSGREQVFDPSHKRGAGPIVCDVYYETRNNLVEAKERATWARITSTTAGSSSWSALSR